MKLLPLILALGLLPACEPGESLGVDDFAGAPVAEDCPDEDRVQAEACDEVHCGDPVVRLGTGGSSFEELQDGDGVDIWRGSQGWYHVFVSAEMEEVCPIVYLRVNMEIPWGPDGELRSIFEAERHVQAVRPDPETTNRQQYWGLQAFLPCALFPDDPDADFTCGEFTSRSGHLEDFPVTLSVEVEDHDGRIAHSKAVVEPECCAF